MGKSRHADAVRHAPGARFAARFWDAVEYEIEALDADDFALFLEADRMPFAERPGVERALHDSLAALCRARFSN